MSMHRFIMDAPKGQQVDHINGNKLDNRKSNLRICSHSENLRNQRKPKDNKSGFKGVSWHKGAKRWCAEIRSNGKRHHLGYFDTAEDAAKAYDIAATLIHGDYARLNFPK